jgi:TrmH family RNA methyltransferase
LLLPLYFNQSKEKSGGNMQPIRSTKNLAVQKLVQLKTKKGRQEQGLYLIEGTRLVREAMLQKAAFAVLVVSSEETGFDDVVELAGGQGADLLSVLPHVMERICDTEQPQGIAAAIKLPVPTMAFGKRVLALDGVSDPGNLGTMLRTAAAFGIMDVLLSAGCTDVYSPKCVRSGMGAHFRLNIHEVDLPKELLSKRKEGFAVIGAAINGEESFPKTGNKRIVVIGSEATGLSSDVAKACTNMYRIPMAESSESLNAAVAAGIVMFMEYSREQNESGLG